MILAFVLGAVTGILLAWAGVGLARLVEGPAPRPAVGPPLEHPPPGSRPERLVGREDALLVQAGDRVRVVRGGDACGACGAPGSFGHRATGLVLCNLCYRRVTFGSLGWLRLAWPPQDPPEPRA